MQIEMLWLGAGSLALLCAVSAPAPRAVLAGLSPAAACDVAPPDSADPAADAPSDASEPCSHVRAAAPYARPECGPEDCLKSVRDFKKSLGKRIFKCVSLSEKRLCFVLFRDARTRRRERVYPFFLRRTHCERAAKRARLQGNVERERQQTLRDKCRTSVQEFGISARFTSAERVFLFFVRGSTHESRTLTVFQRRARPASPPRGEEKGPHSTDYLLSMRTHDIVHKVSHREKRFNSLDETRSALAGGRGGAGVRQSGDRAGLGPPRRRAHFRDGASEPLFEKNGVCPARPAARRACRETQETARAHASTVLALRSPALARTHRRATLLLARTRRLSRRAQAQAQAQAACLAAARTLAVTDTVLVCARDRRRPARAPDLLPRRNDARDARAKDARSRRQEDAHRPRPTLLLRVFFRVLLVLLHEQQRHRRAISSMSRRPS